MPVASLIPRVAFSTGPAHDGYKAATDDPFSPMRSPGIMAAATMLPTPPDEPYNLYLRGRFAWNARTAAGFQEAEKFFNQAIEKET